MGQRVVTVAVAENSHKYFVEERLERTVRATHLVIPSLPVTLPSLFHSTLTILRHNVWYFRLLQVRAASPELTIAPPMPLYAGDELTDVW